MEPLCYMQLVWTRNRFKTNNNGSSHVKSRMWNRHRLTAKNGHGRNYRQRHLVVLVSGFFLIFF